MLCKVTGSYNTVIFEFLVFICEFLFIFTLHVMFPSFGRGFLRIPGIFIRIKEKQLINISNGSHDTHVVSHVNRIQRYVNDFRPYLIPVFTYGKRIEELSECQQQIYGILEREPNHQKIRIDHQNLYHVKYPERIENQSEKNIFKESKEIRKPEIFIGQPNVSVFPYSKAD